jgi:hypothetical protein
LLWHGEPNHDGVSRAVVGPQFGPLHLLTIDADHQVSHCQISGKRRHPITDVVWHRDRMFLFDLASVELIEPRDGTSLAKSDLPKEDQRRCGRFYLADGQWRATSHDGHQFVAQVLCQEGVGPKRILAVLEPSGHSGPVLLFADFTLRTQEGVEMPLGQNHSLNMTRTLAASADGLRFLLTSRPGSHVDSERRLLVSLLDRKVESLPLQPNWRSRLEPEAFQSIRPMCVRNHFDRVGVVDGTLSLRSHKGNELSLQWQTGSGLVWRSTRERAAARRDHGESVGWIRFNDRADSKTQRYSLSEAVFADGSRVILDSRGLLHCRSSDVSIPEFTLVLVEGLIAGWSANGSLFGRGYFIGSETSVSTRPFFDSVLKWFLRRLT